MPIENRDDAHVVTHPLARAALTRLRDVDADPVAFREDLVELGRICGAELVATLFETEQVPVATPLTVASAAAPRSRSRRLRRAIRRYGNRSE